MSDVPEDQGAPPEGRSPTYEEQIDWGIYYLMWRSEGQWWTDAACDAEIDWEEQIRWGEDYMKRYEPSLTDPATDPLVRYNWY